MPRLPAPVHAAAAAQRGVISRAQLIAAGIATTTIDRWVARRWLTAIHLGIYRLPGVTLTVEVRRVAAVLAVGEPVALSGTTAARLHGLPGFDHVERIEVVTRPGRTRRPRGVDVTTSSVLAPTDVVRIDGLPCLGIERTFLGLGAILDDDRLADVASDALSRGLTTRQALEWHVERIGRVPGVAAARRVVDGLLDDDGAYRARTERRGRQLAIEAGLSPGQVNVPVRCCGRDYELDLLFAARSLVVEWDGPHHDRPSQREKDRVRDHHLRDHLHLHVERIAAADVWERPDAVVTRLAAIAGLSTFIEPHIRG